MFNKLFDLLGLSQNKAQITFSRTFVAFRIAVSWTVPFRSCSMKINHLFRRLKVAIDCSKSRLSPRWRLHIYLKRVHVGRSKASVRTPSRIEKTYIPRLASRHLQKLSLNTYLFLANILFVSLWSSIWHKQRNWACIFKSNNRTLVWVL